ncbi:hypothetical protein [Mycobacterium sp.]|uniref:hypothetical protein n=1 Tax=Mycobacterium sp. TaxID=1785 RepID=UPI0025E6B5C4|nr:hypothetical protein [Mycobacterium sp.]
MTTEPLSLTALRECRTELIYALIAARAASTDLTGDHGHRAQGLADQLAISLEHCCQLFYSVEGELLQEPQPTLGGVAQ